MERTLKVIRQREDLDKPTLSVQLILKTGGMEMYSNMCCDRISEEELIDGEDVQINFANFPDINLTADGILQCKEILESYVQDKVLSDAFSLVCEIEMMDREIHKMARIFRDMSYMELVKNYKEMDNYPDDNTIKRIRKYISTEIWSRSIFMAIKRRITKFVSDIYLKIKYRGLFQYMKQAATGVVENT